MKNILIIEDEGIYFLPLKKILKNEGYKILSAPDLNVANDFMEQKDIKIDLIITDLNVDDGILSSDEKKETNEGILNGWIWIKNYVLKKNKIDKDKIIIQSAYIKELRENETFKNLDGITLIDKSDREITSVVLLDTIDRKINR